MSGKPVGFSNSSGLHGLTRTNDIFGSGVHGLIRTNDNFLARTTGLKDFFYLKVKSVALQWLRMIK